MIPLRRFCRPFGTAERRDVLMGRPLVVRAHRLAMRPGAA